jgi:hypothetical protein
MIYNWLFDSFIGFVLIMFLSATIGIYGVGTFLLHASFPGEVAAIEQIRSDLKKLPNNNFLKAKAVEVNANIKTNQYYNTRWWSDLAYPDGWNTVQLLEVKE